MQEWKDTLLRGKDPAKLDKYWGAFQKREQTVDALTADLKAKLPEGESRALIEQFASAHSAMGEGYPAWVRRVEGERLRTVGGDNAVAGVDRQPAALLEQAAQKIAAESAQVSAQAALEAHRANLASISLMLVVLALGLVGGYAFSRSVTRPLGYALDCAKAVSSGDLSHDLHDFDTDGRDEVAQLLQALKHMQMSLSNVMSKVRRNAEDIAMASAEISSGNLDLSSRTEQQAAALEETAASMEQITATVRQNAENAHTASALTDDAT